MLPNYTYALVWSAEDRGYICTCAEFPGVSAFGTDQSHALAEMQVALSAIADTFAAEGRALPAANELPYYSGQFRLRIPRSLHALLSQRAEVEGVSLNTYATLLLSSATGAGFVTDRASAALTPMLGRLEKAVERAERLGR